MLVALVPALTLGVGLAAGRLGANPVEALSHETGEWALRLLAATLAVTPLRKLLGARFLAPYRRTLGLLTFFYASLHLAVYVGLDLFFDWGALVEDVSKRPWITAGFAAFLLMLPLALTSTRRMIRRLGRRWVQIHRLVYLAAPCAVLHFLWQVKADLREPLIYGAVVAALLALRLWWALRRATPRRGPRGPEPAGPAATSGAGRETSPHP